MGKQCTSAKDVGGRLWRGACEPASLRFRLLGKCSLVPARCVFTLLEGRAGRPPVPGAEASAELPESHVVNSHFARVLTQRSLAACSWAEGGPSRWV